MKFSEYIKRGKHKKRDRFGRFLLFQKEEK